MASPGRNAIRCPAGASPWRTPIARWPAFGLYWRSCWPRSARENGELEQYVGPRVMEGLIMAGIGLTARQYPTASGGLSGVVPLGGQRALSCGGGCGTGAVAGNAGALACRVPRHQRRSILTTAPPGDAVRGVSATTGLPVRRAASRCRVPGSVPRHTRAVAGEALAPSAVAGLTGRRAAGARRSAASYAASMAAGAGGLSGAGAG